MRYDKKIDLIRIYTSTDEFGGMGDVTREAIDTVDAFISPETIKVIEIGDGITVKKGVAKVFTKAQISIDSEKQRIEVSKARYNGLRFNMINIIPTKAHKNIKLIYGTLEYDIISITDLGKITMMEVERNV